MDLQEFVRESLVQISKGIVDSNAVLKDIECFLCRL